MPWKVERVPEQADENDVMREQLEALIRHAEDGHGSGGACSDCARYLRVRLALFEIFGHPAAPADVPEPRVRPSGRPLRRAAAA